MNRFIPAVVVLAPHDSNVAVYAKSVDCFACEVSSYTSFSDWLI